MVNSSNIFQYYDLRGASCSITDEIGKLQEIDDQTLNSYAERLVGTLNDGDLDNNVVGLNLDNAFEKTLDALKEELHQ